MRVLLNGSAILPLKNGTYTFGNEDDDQKFEFTFTSDLQVGSSSMGGTEIGHHTSFAMNPLSLQGKQTEMVYGGGMQNGPDEPYRDILVSLVPVDTQHVRVTYTVLTEGRLREG